MSVCAWNMTLVLVTLVNGKAFSWRSVPAGYNRHGHVENQTIKSLSTTGEVHRIHLVTLSCEMMGPGHNH